MKLLCAECNIAKEADVVYQGNSLCAECFVKHKKAEEGTENELMGFKP